MYWHFYGLPCVVALEKGIDWFHVSDSFQCWSFDFFAALQFSMLVFQFLQQKTAYPSETGKISTILLLRWFLMTKRKALQSCCSSEDAFKIGAQFPPIIADLARGGQEAAMGCKCGEGVP